jgi:hypothetical protein
MGNANSKPGASLNKSPHNPTRMSIPRSPGVANLATTFALRKDSAKVNEVIVTAFAGDESDESKVDITCPTPARPLIRRYSELWDPAQLEAQQIRSPSGNLLSGSNYALRSDRPLSVRERQERIRQRMEQQRNEAESASVKESKRNSAKSSLGSSSTKRIKKSKAFLGCFGA